MIVTKKLWFSPMGGLIGLMLGHDDVTGKPKAYIGRCSLGASEEVNVKEVLQRGAKFTESHLRDLVDHFKLDVL